MSVSFFALVCLNLANFINKTTDSIFSKHNLYAGVEKVSPRLCLVHMLVSLGYRDGMNQAAKTSYFHMVLETVTLRLRFCKC